MIEVLKPGPLSALQDLGRVGHQRFGVIASGVMDEWAHRTANLLVGNAADEASLEITLMGPVLRFHADALIALAGADLSPMLDDQPLPMATPVLVRAGARLAFGRRLFGCRVCLAVRGGFPVPPVMGSRSTYLRAGFGGFEGRALRAGDRLPLGPDAGGAAFGGLRRALAAGEAPMALPPDFEAPVHPALAGGALRVIAGQQWPRFTAQARESLVSDSFTVNRNSDRMGYRLEGPALALSAPLEMISEAVTFGTVQVPPDGQPIVLMADRQTTGGYPKIATVASVDLPLMAQKLPGDSVRFTGIELDAARALDAAREAQFGQLRTRIASLMEN